MWKQYKDDHDRTDGGAAPVTGGQRALRAIPGRAAERAVGRIRFAFPVTVLAVHLLITCHAVAQDVRTASDPLIYRNWRTFTTRDGLPHNSIRTMLSVGDRIWIGTEGGLVLRGKDHFKAWTQEDGLPHPAVNTIDVDSQTGDLWIGTWGGGLARFSAGRFDTFDQLNSGLAGNLVFSVAVFDGRVWAATNGGLSVFDPASNTWGLYHERRPNGPDIVLTRLIRMGDDLYGGAWCDGVWRYDKTRDRWIAVGQAVDELTCVQPDVQPSFDTTVSISTGGSSLWWATQTKILRRAGTGVWDARDIPSIGTPSGFVNEITIANESQAWLCTEQGAMVITDWATDTWCLYKRSEAPTGGSVTLVRGGRVIHSMTMSSGICDNRVRCAAFRGDDIWIGTANGLALGTNPERIDMATLSVQAGADRFRDTFVSLIDADLSPPAYAGAAYDDRYVRIGILGPRNRTTAMPGTFPRNRLELGRSDLLACQIAVEEANARGGYRGEKRFAVSLGTRGYANYAWGTPEDEYATLSYDYKVAGIVGYFGPGSRAATAVAGETAVPVVNVGLGPVSIDQQISPWIFRCLGDEPRQLGLLLDHIVDRMGKGRLAVLRTPGRVAAMHVDWWVDHAGRRGHPVAIDLRYDPCADNLEPVLDSLQTSKASAVLTWCDAALSAMLVRRMREAGLTQLFVGSDEIVDERFTELVGPDPGEVIAAYPITNRARRAPLSDFAGKYAEQNVAGGVERPPGLDAYAAYDATLHLLDAINRAGLDREAIRQTLTAMSHSADGEKHFTESHRPGGSMFARLQGGRWTFHSLPQP